ncbi:MAG: hypothetical protein AAGD96_17415 [Chloroflexota bacterium]
MNKVVYAANTSRDKSTALPPYTSSFMEYLQHCWPQFLHRQGCIVLGDVKGKDLAEMLYITQNSKASVETQLNRRRLIQLLPANAPVSVAELTQIGTMLKEMWQAKLRKDFPNKSFSVIFTEGKTGLDVENFEITFFQNSFSRQ